MKKIYLLGVNHAVQWNTNKDKTTFYLQYLKKIIRKYNIQFIGEEWNSDSSKINNILITTTHKLSDKLGIPYEECDPNIRERESRGIPNNNQILKKLNIHAEDLIKGTRKDEISIEQSKYFCIREKYWLEQLNKHKFNTAIFICGSQHLVSFHNLIGQNGIKSEILPVKFD